MKLNYYLVQCKLCNKKRIIIVAFAILFSVQGWQGEISFSIKFWGGETRLFLVVEEAKLDNFYWHRINEPHKTIHLVPLKGPQCTCIIMVYEVLISA